MTIEAYFTKLSKLWDTLDILQPVRSCKCNACTCNLLELLGKDRDENHLQQLLYGVDDQFQNVRSNLITRTPLPSVEEAYNMLRQEEDLHSNHLQIVDRSEAMAFAVKTSFEDRSKLFCSSCKKRGHSSDKCFAVIGYPDWWEERNRYKTSNGKREKLAGSIPTRAVANAVTAAPQTAAPVITNLDNDGVIGLNSVQWQQVMTLLNSGNTNPTENSTGPQYEDGDWSG